MVLDMDNHPRLRRSQYLIYFWHRRCNVLAAVASRKDIRRVPK